MLLPLFESLLIGGAMLFLYWVLIQISLYMNPLRKLPYPPSPPPRDFILGHARDLQSKPLWIKLADWGETYGSIMHLRALDKHLVVLNSVDDAIELLEKRSNNYSDRPYFPMLYLLGGNFGTPVKPYGPTWHTHRRLFQQAFNPRASLEFRPVQVEKVNDMLYSLLDTPKDFMTHIKTLAVAIVMATTYGYKVLPKDDPFQKIAEEAGTGIFESANPDASIVNVLPFLRFLPTWFPGADFHRVARVAKEKVTKLQEVPFKYVQDNLAVGTASPSFVASLLETCKSEEDYIILKEVAATVYIGADTTTSVIGTFIYTMTMYPDIQKKAQEELDRVIGMDRVASYDDEPSLPYIQAVYREVLRWRPAIPLGVLHATSAEDVYNGYYIPKGATIIPNAWAMTRDPIKYKDPEEFNPGRFFDENNELNNDDMAYVFGFGRRICAGRHMAAATVWLAMATVLSTFNIRPPKDEYGKDISFDVEYSDGMIVHPHPFECSITPRSIQAKQLILDIRNNTIE